MNVLFLHQNFPGQYRSLAPALVREGHNVCALTANSQLEGVWKGVVVLSYKPARRSTPNIHPWLMDMETKVIRGEAVYNAAKKMRSSGYVPDVILAHPSWGEALFIKEVWPEVPLGLYCEFFYLASGAAIGYDPEFQERDQYFRERVRAKNFNNLLHFDLADAGVSPTLWQANTYPPDFRSKISVIHDGIDTVSLVPDPAATIRIRTASNTDITLSKEDEVITFVNRNLEPARGYHRFMRALPDIFSERRNVRVLIVGGDGASYGAPPDSRLYGLRSWKQIFWDEVAPKLGENSRKVHFLGNVSYSDFTKILKISRVHVYLTYPFVLSWSLLEAMSLECAVVASDTPPVREVIENGGNGILVDFFDHTCLAREVCRLLEDKDARMALGVAARRYTVKNFDLTSVTLPQQLRWVKKLARLSAG